MVDAFVAGLIAVAALAVVLLALSTMSTGSCVDSEQYCQPCSETNGLVMWGQFTTWLSSFVWDPVATPGVCVLPYPMVQWPGLPQGMCDYRENLLPTSACFWQGVGRFGKRFVTLSLDAIVLMFGEVFWTIALWWLLVRMGVLDLNQPHLWPQGAFLTGSYAKELVSTRGIDDALVHAARPWLAAEVVWASPIRGLVFWIIAHPWIWRLGVPFVIVLRRVFETKPESAPILAASERVLLAGVVVLEVTWTLLGFVGLVDLTSSDLLASAVAVWVLMAIMVVIVVGVKQVRLASDTAHKDRIHTVNGAVVIGLILLEVLRVFVLGQWSMWTLVLGQGSLPRELIAAIIRLVLVDCAPALAIGFAILEILHALHLVPLVAPPPEYLYPVPSTRLRSPRDYVSFAYRTLVSVSRDSGKADMLIIACSAVTWIFFFSLIETDSGAGALRPFLSPYRAWGLLSSPVRWLLSI